MFRLNNILNKLSGSQILGHVFSLILNGQEEFYFLMMVISY